jgi:hypothetical protein
VESEIELPFAALQQLCAPILSRRERLPSPQHDALGVAFGLSPGPQTDRFLVTLAVLSLLSEVAKEQALLVVVDDAQWLDRASAQALAFVARRLLAEPVALVFATREPNTELTGLRELVVGGLCDGDARALRSVVYGSAPLRARREAHRALAHVTDPQVDPDRRAWHRAQAAPGPDEEVACELERSADSAQTRGGLSAAAAFLEKASALTLEPAPRARRGLAAARAHSAAGAFDVALGLLATAEAGPLNELQRAQADRLRGQIAFASGPSGDAPPLLLKAAEELERLDPARARDTYLEALTAALYASHLAGGAVMAAVNAAKAAPPSPQPPRGSDLLLDGLVLLLTDGHGAAAPSLRRALDAFRRQEAITNEGPRWLMAAAAAGMLWDAEAWDVLTARLVKLARDAGALNVLMMGLPSRATLHVFAGEFAMAAALTEQASAVAGASGQPARRGPRYGALALAAFRGREAEASAVIDDSIKDFRAGEGMGLTAVEWARAVLYNGLARYEDALVLPPVRPVRPSTILGTRVGRCPS